MAENYRHQIASIVLCVVSAFLAAGLPAAPSLAQPQQRPELSLELVDPTTLRVCADPHNMPFSTNKGEGFENKLAELFAAQLARGLSYAWYPQAPGFVRNTLGAYKCDVVMGMPQGDDLVQVTNPYYRTAYALVFKQGSGLEGVDTIGDVRLKGKRIGVVAGTPPATNMAVNGLMANAKAPPSVWCRWSRRRRVPGSRITSRWGCAIPIRTGSACSTARLSKTRAPSTSYC